MRKIVVTLSNGKRALYSQYIKPHDVNLHVPDDGKLYVRFIHDYEKAPHYKPRQLVNFKTDIAIPEIANEVKRVGPDPEFGNELRAYEYLNISISTKPALSRSSYISFAQ